MVEPVIRAARPDEAQMLTEIALRSKAHWGYSQELLDLWADDLRISPDSCDGESVWVIEREGQLAGFGEILFEGDIAILDDLWIAPENIGSGLGRQLFRHLAELAHLRGVTRLQIESEPNAVGFYRSMGAEVRGERASVTVQGRSLPLMELKLA